MKRSSSARRVARCSLPVAAPAHAELNVFACEPEWGALAQELGGDTVTVYVATTALQDPHQIQARPSLIAKARSADLVGLHRRRAGDRLAAACCCARPATRKVAAGHAGLFRGRAACAPARSADAARPRRRRRACRRQSAHPDRSAQHARGVAKALAARLAAARSGQRRDLSRSAQADFASAGARRSTRWAAQAAPLQGHEGRRPPHSWVYLVDWLGMTRDRRAGAQARRAADAAAISRKCCEQLQRTAGARCVIRAAYQDDARRPNSSRKHRRAGGRAALHRRRHDGGQGPVRLLRRHDRPAAGGAAKPDELRRPRLLGILGPAFLRRAAGAGHACAAGPAGAGARHHLHRPGDRAGRRAGRHPRRRARLRAARLVGVQVAAAARGAARRAAC